MMRYVKLCFVFCAALTAAMQAETLMPEGFVVNGIEGVATKSESSGEDWIFVPSVDLTYIKTVLDKGTPLPILPSSGLGQIHSIAGDKKEMTVRIWGILTQYHEKNYLFPIQVLPLTRPQPVPVEPEPETPVETADPNADPNTDEVIPAEWLKILRTQPRVDLVRLSETAVTPDGREFSLIGKAGYLTLGETKFFVPDAFGRNVEKTDYILLPCLTLEKTEEKLSRGLGRYRYTISGIMTECQGKKYLLLYRAVRTYSNHNFAP
jgi:hypothetical protein